MDAQQVRRRVPKIKFRVLIIGRANAGKTSILQRVCDTTESPEIYRVRQGADDRERVQLNPTTECGQHNIEDELVFTNHEGYVFHDSRGFESGSANELKTVQRFVREKSREKRLKDRLHAIWYCIPMDNQRPSLDLKHFNDICPDQNVPVIAVFTKYDQFKRNVKMKLEDEGCPSPQIESSSEADRMFHNLYLSELGGIPKFVRLERMHKCGERCTELIETTANALNNKVIVLMLLAVQRKNLEVNIKLAVKYCTEITEVEQYATKMVHHCLMAFPLIWYWFDNLLDDNLLDLELNDLDNLLLLDDDLLLFDTREVISSLTSFLNDVPHACSVSHGHRYSIMIVTILILEHAILQLVSNVGGDNLKALHQAHSQYMLSNAQAAIDEWLTVPPLEDRVEQFTEFICNHRLSL